MLTELLKFGLAAVAGLVGSFFGARLALKQFKTQRSYESRLEWHRSALDALHEAHEQIKLVKPFSPVPDALRQALNRVSRRAAEAPAFTSDIAQRYLKMVDVYAWSLLNPTPLKGNDPPSREAIDSALDEIFDTTKTVHDAIRILVGELKLLYTREPDGPWWKRTYKQLKAPRPPKDKALPKERIGSTAEGDSKLVNAPAPPTP